jgi:glutamine synthetase
MGAFENEFFLLRRDAAEVAPVDWSVFAQTYVLDQQAAVIDDITAALDSQGIQVEMVYAESGPGQLEMPIRYADALAAADRQVAFRETVRAVAHRHGLIASFLPKIFLDRAGSGSHLHFSLWEGERNLTADPRRPTTISAEAASFAAGLLEHLPALMALTIPSANSFKRIRPRFWSGAYACWGYDNREAPVRVPTQAAGEGVTNIELKTVDGTCNPYLALGGAIAAGLDGVERGLTLGEPVQQDPGDWSDDERAARGIRTMPTTLGAALAALEQDRLLLDALGPGLADSFVAVRRAEWEALKDTPHEEEVRLLVERY